MTPSLPFLVFACTAFLVSGCTQVTPEGAHNVRPGQHTLDSTISYCRSSLGKHPDDADLHALLGEALFDNVRRSANYYRVIARNEFDLEPTFLKDIGSRISQLPVRTILDTLYEAESHLLRAIALRPGQAATHRALGRIYMALGRSFLQETALDRAKEEFTASLALDSLSAEAYHGLGYCSLRQERPEEALAALEKSLDLDSSAGSTYLSLGEVYLKLEKTAIAFACFENAAKNGLAEAPEYLRLARFYTNETAERKLLGPFSFLREKASGIFKPVARTVLQSLKVYHPTIALDLCRRALAMDSSFAQAYLLRSLVYYREGDVGMACSDYAQAVDFGTAPYWDYAASPPDILERLHSLRPASQVVLYLLGNSLLRDQQHEAAIRIFKEAVAGKPDGAAPYFLLGHAYLLHGDTAKATECLDKVISLPEEAFPRMYYMIYYWYCGLRYFSKAVETCQKWFLADGRRDLVQNYEKRLRTRDYSPGSLRLAASYCEIGFLCSWSNDRAERTVRRGKAKEYFTRASALAPGLPVPFVGLGMLSEEMGDTTSACAYYERAVSLGDDSASESLHRLRHTEVQR